MLEIHSPCWGSQVQLSVGGALCICKCVSVASTGAAVSECSVSPQIREMILCFLDWFIDTNHST